jgi:hypothetical protein
MKTRPEKILQSQRIALVYAFTFIHVHTMAHTLT